MADPFIAQIVMFGGNFAPRGWALCDGQLLSISQNTALFSLLGTTYGGDGRTTFGLPDLRGRIAMHPGNGPGLPSYNLGQKAGIYQKQLGVNEMPSHNHSHAPACNSSAADSDTPVNAVPSVDETASESFNSAANNTMLASPTMNTGGGATFSIQNPFLTVNFIIALQGIFPSRN